MMNQINNTSLFRWASLLMVIILLSACSTTRNLPDGEVLYTGIRKIAIQNEDSTKAGQAALEEIEAALAYPPNNAIFGSSSLRTPFPFGLWIYNGFVNKKSKFSKWIFNKLAAKPVLISTVSPDVRTKVVQNLLREYGYFNGTASYSVLPDKKDSLKAKVSYQIDMRQPYKIDTVIYTSISPKADSIVRQTLAERAIRPNDNFSVIKLEEERQRLASIMRNKGYYYFRPDFIAYQADTLNYPGRVGLKVISKPGLPATAVRPWHVGNISYSLNGYDGETPTDSILYKDLMIYYEGKLRVRPRILYNRLFFRKGDLYKQSVQEKTQSALNRLSIFQYTDMQYTPKDTSLACDTLNLRINAMYELPLDGELELNVTSKSNNQAGPGAVVSLTRRNLFKGGEVLGITLRGSYEYATRSSACMRVSSSKITSLLGATIFTRAPSAFAASSNFLISLCFEPSATKMPIKRLFSVLGVKPIVCSFSEVAISCIGAAGSAASGKSIPNAVATRFAKSSSILRKWASIRVRTCAVSTLPSSKAYAEAICACSVGVWLR